VNVFLDESGKFKDDAVISFCGVVGDQGAFREFGACWAHCLQDNGIEMLSAKDAFNANRALSEKNPALGSARESALMPFIACIRKHLDSVRGVSIDAEAFRNLPSHYFKVLGDDPFFTAFLRAVLDAVNLVPEGDRLTMICDDEEQMALPMYRLYRRIKSCSQKFETNLLRSVLLTTDICLLCRLLIWLHHWYAGNLARLSIIRRMTTGIYLLPSLSRLTLRRESVPWALPFATKRSY